MLIFCVATLNLMLFETDVLMFLGSLMICILLMILRQMLMLGYTYRFDVETLIYGGLCVLATTFNRILLCCVHVQGRIMRAVRYLICWDVLLRTKILS